MKSKILLLAASCVAWACFGPAAHAAISIVSAVGGQPISGANYVTFNDLSAGGTGGFAANTTASGGITVSFTPDAKVVSGAASGLYAPPFLSNNNGLNFGGQGNGADATNYLTSGSDGGSYPAAKAVLTFSSKQQYFGLLWGSVDKYNTLQFFDNATLVGTIDGSQVDANATGDQGTSGTFYVNISSTLGFDKVVATSSQYAFEFDNVAYSQYSVDPQGVLSVPEPASIIVWSLLALMLGGANWWRRRSG